MEAKEEDGFVVVKLSDGEDLFECLNNVIERFGVESGFVMLGVGMLSDIKIGYYTKAGYRYHDLEAPHELVDLHGSISTKEEVVIHLHCGLADEDHRMTGGHLVSAKVCMVNEILIKKLKSVVLGRTLNANTGLKELTVE